MSREAKALGMVAKGLGLIEQPLHSWVEAADGGEVGAPGRDGIIALRAENTRLRMA